MSRFRTCIYAEYANLHNNLLILLGCFFCTEPELNELHMIEQLHILVVQHNKTGAFKFSASVVL